MSPTFSTAPRFDTSTDDGLGEAPNVSPTLFNRSHAGALQNHVASIPAAADESKDDGLAMIGAELQSLRAELVAPPAARAHRRSSFAALKADLVELKKRGGVDEDALAYVKQDIATYVRELREEAKPDAFDGDNANAMREELRILQKELADVRDAQARRPASPRSPRSPRTPRAVWIPTTGLGAPTKLQNSLSRSNRSRFG